MTVTISVVGWLCAGTLYPAGIFKRTTYKPSLDGSPESTAIWARAHLRDLEDRYAGLPGHHTGELARMERQITDVSLRYGVLCRFTAFIAVDSRVITDGGVPHRVTQPVELPAGWDLAGRGLVALGNEHVIFAVRHGVVGLRDVEVGDREREPVVEERALHPVFVLDAIRRLIGRKRGRGQIGVTRLQRARHGVTRGVVAVVERERANGPHDHAITHGRAGNAEGNEKGWNKSKRHDLHADIEDDDRVSASDRNLVPLAKQITQCIKTVSGIDIDLMDMVTREVMRRRQTTWRLETRWLVELFGVSNETVARLRSIYAHYETFDMPDYQLLERSYAILKAMYELRYELNNRPKWAAIPLRGLLQLAAKQTAPSLVTA